MAYPKPLSERTLKKMYLDAGINDEQKDFLHTLFNASMNLYGAAMLRDIWQVYVAYSKTHAVPKIRRRMLLDFSMITRREDQPYQILELDEVYEADTKTELDRLLVSKALIGKGYGKYFLLYELVDRQRNHSFYVPDDMERFAENVSEPEEKAFSEFISGLRSTARECKSEREEQYHLNPNQGKMLDEFSFLNREQTIMADYLKDNPKQLAYIMEDYRGTEAEKILRLLKQDCMIGFRRYTDIIKELVGELNEVGVELSEMDLNKLISLLNEFQNNLHLWCNCGWKPVDLRNQQLASGQPFAPFIVFGPGMQKAFREGTIDKNELTRQMKNMGLDVK